MSLNTSNGVMHSAPRVIETKDTRGDCPGVLAAGGTIISQSFTVSNPAIYWTHGRVIFINKARADFDLRINGATVKSALDTSLSETGALGGWEELDATHAGTLAAGTHTITMIASNGANNWGCGPDWGELVTMIWEVQ